MEISCFLPAFSWLSFAGYISTKLDQRTPLKFNNSSQACSLNSFSFQMKHMLSPVSNNSNHICSFLPLSLMCNGSQWFKGALKRKENTNGDAMNHFCVHYTHRWQQAAKKKKMLVRWKMWFYFYSACFVPFCVQIFFPTDWPDYNWSDGSVWLLLL